MLNAVAATSLAKRRGSTITSADWVQFAKDLGVLPQTADNYLSHISALYQLARPAWGYHAAAAGTCGRLQEEDRRDALDRSQRAAHDRPGGLRQSAHTGD